MPDFMFQYKQRLDTIAEIIETADARALATALRSGTRPMEDLTADEWREIYVLAKGAPRGELYKALRRRGRSGT